MKLFSFLVTCLFIHILFATQLPYLAPSDQFGAYQVILFRGSFFDITSTTQMDNPQIFTYETGKTYTNIQQIALALTSFLIKGDLYAQALALASPSIASSFSISFYSTKKIYTMSYTIIIVCNPFYGTYAELVINNRYNCSVINSSANQARSKNQSLLQSSSNITLGSSNLSYLTFVHSISVPTDGYGSVSGKVSSLVSVIVAPSSPNNMNVTIHSNFVNVSIEFVGYTIMILNKTTLTTYGSFYSSVYQISYNTLMSDISANFNIPSIYGPNFDQKCIIGLGSMFISIFVDIKGFFFNFKTAPISQAYKYSGDNSHGSGNNTEMFNMNIFCYMDWKCPNNMNLVNSTCQCTSPQFEVNSYCISTVGCINVTTNQTGSLVCNQCGYGLTLNSSSYSCICLDFAVSGGCTKIPYCSYISYVNSTSSYCLTCRSTFTFVDGQCKCAYGLHFNQTNNSCVCLVNYTSGHCNIISNCLQISYSAWNISQCLVCSSGYNLINGTCVLAASSSPTVVTTPISTEGLDNVSLTVLISIVSVLMLVMIGFIIYQCFKLSSFPSNSAQTYPNPQNDMSSISKINMTEETIFKPDAANINTNLRGRKRRQQQEQIIQKEDDFHVDSNMNEHPKY